MGYDEDSNGVDDHENGDCESEDFEVVNELSNGSEQIPVRLSEAPCYARCAQHIYHITV